MILILQIAAGIGLFYAIALFFLNGGFGNYGNSELPERRRTRQPAPYHPVKMPKRDWDLALAAFLFGENPNRR
jgi:hypothetical protein